MQIFLSLFAGIGLIFIGSQFLTAGVRQVVGARLRDILAQSTRSVGRAMIVGVGAGAIIQSPNAIAFVAAGLIGAGAMTVEAASLIVIWSYVGNLTKLFAAAIDLQAVALVGLGIVGLGYYLEWDKHRVRQHWIKALLGLSLLLTGIQLMIAGTVPLRSAPWVRDIIVGAETYYPVGFLIGAVLAVVAQGTTVAIILIGVARGGLLEMDQAAIVAAGALLGMGFFSYMQAANLQGEERQLSVLQLILKIIATAILLPLLLVEHFFGIPTVLAASKLLSDDISMRLIFLWWLGGILPAIVLLPVNQSVCRLLARLSPATQEQSLARPRFIFAQAAEDPASALNLVLREQSRVFEVVPTTLERVCEGGRTDINANDLSNGANTLLATIEQFLAATLRAAPGSEYAERVISAQYVNQIMHELIATTTSFADVIATARSGRQELDIYSDLAEPLHAMLATVSDRMASGSAPDAAAITQLGRPRDELFADLRARVMEQSAGHSWEQQEAFYKASRLFERVVWLVFRLGTSLSAVLQDPVLTRTAATDGSDRAIAAAVEAE